MTKKGELNKREVVPLPSSIDIPPMVKMGWNAYAQMGVAEVLSFRTVGSSA